MYRFLIAILVLVSIASGCGGSSTGSGSTGSPPPPSPVVGSGNLGDANTGRLVPTGDLGTTGVSGEFLVQGFTILDEEQNAVNPGEGGPKLLARLIDPEDDILSVANPGIDGRYELYTTQSVTEAKLQLEFRVLEDVDGDGQGNDLIVQTVPVLLVPGFISIVNMTISPGTIHNLAPEFQTLDGLGGFSVVVGVERTDGNGEYNETFALFPDGLLYIDDDNNEFIEPGQDSFWEDANRNGWPDSEEEGYDGFSISDWVYLEGTVLSVDTAGQTLFLFVDFAEVLPPNGIPQQDPSLTGEVLQVRKLSSTVMEGMVLPGDAEMSGDLMPEDIRFTDPFPLDSSLVGRMVIVQGLYDGNSVEAELIFEVSREPSLPLDGGL